jgi:hypothetical protein
MYLHQRSARPHPRPFAALRALLACAAAGCAVAACAPPSLVVQVAPGAAPGKPRFTLPADAGTVYGLAVVPCGGGAPRWQFGTGGGILTAVPPTLTYGELPPGGFTLLAGPEPLTPGCYEVFTGAAVGRFTVQRDGTVVPAAAPRPAAPPRVP